MVCYALVQISACFVLFLFVKWKVVDAEYKRLNGEKAFGGGLFSNELMNELRPQTSAVWYMGALGRHEEEKRESNDQLLLW